MVFIVPIFVFLSVLLIVMAIPALQTQPLRARMLRSIPIGDTQTFESEIDKPLLEKLFLPFLMWLGGFIGSKLPAQVLAETERRLQQAGYPLGLNLNSFML